MKIIENYTAPPLTTLPICEKLLAFKARTWRTLRACRAVANGENTLAVQSQEK
ncbi:hypothetical protein [Chromobacterium vaccinii]|uniref:hypothetical protein n=1 Tax=Chromobacterium vaccinii TaxID=1108595 RepID=UPI000E164464|nr:hypothetical protein [Chromobacterium vaccinii]SUX53841.1 Uncharacterised protein [Chromobacterium vaccinii]